MFYSLRLLFSKKWLLCINACCFIILILNRVGMAQGIMQPEYGKKQLGVYLMSGGSIAIVPKSSSVNNQIDDQRRGFVGSGFYYFIQLRNDSIYSTAGFVRFMRVDLGLSNRAGVFELAPGNYATLNSAGLDLTALFPLSFKAAAEIDAYIAAGPLLSYRYNWTITPAQPLPIVDKYKAGVAWEMGFRLKSGSAIGYRTMIDIGDFSYRVGSVFFAFSPQNTYKKKTIAK